MTDMFEDTNETYEDTAEKDSEISLDKELTDLEEEKSELPFEPDEETSAAERRLQRSASALEEEIARPESRESGKSKLGRLINSRGKSIVNKGKSPMSFLEKLGYNPNAEHKPTFIETHVHDSKKRIAIYILIIIVVIVVVVFKFTLFPHLGIFNR